MNTFPIFLTLAISAIISFLAHHWGEKFVIHKRNKPFRIIIKGYQFHHSCFGVLAIFAAPILASTLIMVAMLGFGIGNLWQHKKTHNSVNEKGFIFISKAI